MSGHSAIFVEGAIGVSTSKLEAENRHLRARLETLGFLASIRSGGDGDAEQRRGALPAPSDSPEFVFDSRRDTALAHKHSDFKSVLHIFNEEYFGIRAAAGNLPGHKLSVTAERSLSAEASATILDIVTRKGFKYIVLHGYSHNMDKLARRIAYASGLKLHCVWHGNLAQLVYKDERGSFQRWLKLQEDGLVSRAHILKQNSSIFLKCGYAPILLNLPPNWAGGRISAPFEIRGCATAFLPSWSDIRKNWHANMLAAARIEAVQRVLHYADAKPLFQIGKPVERIAFNVATHMEVVASVDIVLNATLIDCHPMVDLEALACRTPAITARLFLNGLDEHPYARLTNVENALDVNEIAQCAGRVAEIPSGELNAIMTDYSNLLISNSLTRYAEFLGL